MSTLLDERSATSLRSIIGGLLSRSAYADIAVAHVRLVALDLADTELSAVRRCRILIGRLDARTLGSGFVADASAARTARALLHFIDSDRVEIRSSGLATWSPDFSVFREIDGDTASRICLVGAHWFREPVAVKGPSFTACIDDRAQVELVCARFNELWEYGHDVRDAVLATIRSWSALQP